MSTVITCPTWCETEHSGETFGEQTDLHFKYFGDGRANGEANVYVCVEISLKDGNIVNSEFGFNIETSSDPEDMEEIAKWCLDAAAFMREIRGALVTA